MHSSSVWWRSVGQKRKKEQRTRGGESSSGGAKGRTTGRVDEGSFGTFQGETALGGNVETEEKLRLLLAELESKMWTDEEAISTQPRDSRPQPAGEGEKEKEKEDDTGDTEEEAAEKLRVYLLDLETTTQKDEEARIAQVAKDLELANKTAKRKADALLSSPGAKPTETAQQRAQRIMHESPSSLTRRKDRILKQQRKEGKRQGLSKTDRESVAGSLDSQLDAITGQSSSSG